MTYIQFVCDYTTIMEVSIENIVVSCSLGTRLNLQSMISTLNFAEYNKKGLAALILRTVDPSSAALIFASGSVVLSGHRTMNGARRTILNISELIKTKCGVKNCGVNNFIVQNIVGIVDVGRRIDLDAMLEGLGHGCAQYQHELFPGLLFNIPRLEDGTKISIAFFKKGKCKITGAKSFERIAEYTKKVYEIARPYMREESSLPSSQVVIDDEELDQYIFDAYASLDTI